MAEIKNYNDYDRFSHMIDGTEYAFRVPEMPDDHKSDFCKTVGWELDRLYRLTRERTARDVQRRIQEALGLTGE